MIEYFILLIIMTMLGSVAALFLKYASASGSFVSMLKNYNLYLGGALYFASAVANIIVLRKLDYSVVLPLTSITYIWTMILSNAVLKEKITKKKIAGVILILVGAICLSIIYRYT